MRSFISVLFFVFLLSISCLPNGLVDARIHTPPAKANSIGPVEQVGGVSNLFQSSQGSLGGGAKAATTFSRNLAQSQSWARDDDGKILWWIWLIIGLSCGLCCVICCCASACCLRD